MIKLSVETIYGGGLVERLHGEIDRVLENIMDVNTPAKKPRKVKLELTIKPNEQRNMAEVIVSTSCTTCAPEPIETSITFGKDFRSGEIEAFEMAPSEQFGQQAFEGTMDSGKILTLKKGTANA